MCTFICPLFPSFIQPYAEHVFALQNGLARFEPEVALALALALALGHDYDDPPEGPDAFLADHSFEYIDGERTRTRTRHPEMASASEENGEDVDDDVQGLSRVVDALSTIMWPTMVRGNSAKRETSELRPSLFDFDDAVLLAEGEEDDEEGTLAALIEADAAEQGAPQTRASRMRREMEALERWLVEDEELHKAEFGGAGVDDVDDDDEDEDEDEGHDGNAPPPSVQASAALDMHTPIDDPWAASSNPTSTPTSSTALAPYSISITTPSSGFDDDFSAFVSAPPAVSIAGDSAAAKTTTNTSTASPAFTSAFEPIADARPSRLHTQTQLLLPSHTGGSFRSIRSAVSEMSMSDTGDDLLGGGGGGYEALDDRSNSSLNFSPEHDDDADPSTSMGGGGQRSGDRAASLGDGPFDLPNILSALQTIREDVAGIEDEAERRATTARFASEFVFRSMGVDGDEREETES
jgi:hypothetical protein